MRELLAACCREAKDVSEAAAWDALAAANAKARPSWGRTSPCRTLDWKV